MRLLGLLLWLTTTARAEPITLRIATQAPEGTAWAREMHAMANDVEHSTGGRLRIKSFFGGIAGDEAQQAERIKRGQLDGVAAGAWCAQVSPAMRVLRLPGLLQTREQANYVLTRLHPRIAQEFAQAGFVDLAEPALGATVTFTRNPVRTLAELREAKLWRWDMDDIGIKVLKQMGFHPVSLSLEAAARAYDEGRTDGFYAITAAALAFQWSTKARYFTPLPIDYLAGCIVVTTAAWDRLPLADREILKAATAKVAGRAAEAIEAMNAALIDGLFQKQGLAKVAVSEQFSKDFFAAAHQARKELGEKLVARDVLAQVLEWLADYQTERATEAKRPAH